MQKLEGHNKLGEMQSLGLVCALVLGVMLGGARDAAAQPGPTTMQRKPLSPEIEKLISEKPVINLVTMGVGGLIWERHGHIALCVSYDNPRDDMCFNYGIGDFHRPLRMGWGFFRASGAFWVGKQYPRDMLAIYRNADRTIWVQPLPLTKEQKDKVLAKLEFDVLEENKHYSYDHLWDNCTTRVRDIIDDAIGGLFKKMPNKTDGRTFRELAREGFHGLPSSWIPLIITDISMGRVSDSVPNYWERMFLPDYMREAVTDLWGIEPMVIYQRQGPFAVKEIEKTLADGGLSPEKKAELQNRLDELHDEPSGRLYIAFLVLLLTSPVWLTRLVGRFQRTGLAIAVIPPVLFGTIYWFLAIVSPLPYVRWNETLLCLMPFDLALLFLSGENKKKYARYRVIMLALVAALLLIDVLKAPIWTVWLWAIIPSAVVAFMPMSLRTKDQKPPVAGTAIDAEPEDAANSAKKKKKAKKA
ncbi:MAG: DUF4105 domain-containing protein [Kofleriaceae bacterium]